MEIFAAVVTAGNAYGKDWETGLQMSDYAMAVSGVGAWANKYRKDQGNAQNNGWPPLKSLISVVHIGEPIESGESLA